MAKALALQAAFIKPGVRIFRTHINVRWAWWLACNYSAQKSETGATEQASWMGEL